MFKTYRKVIKHVATKGANPHLTVYLPKNVRDIYLKYLENSGIYGKFVAIYGNEKNGIMILAPAQAEKMIEEIGIENVGHLIAGKDNNNNEQNETTFKETDDIPKNLPVE